MKPEDQTDNILRPPSQSLTALRLINTTCLAGSQQEEADCANLLITPPGGKALLGDLDFG